MNDTIARRLRDEAARGPGLRLNVGDLLELHGDASVAVLLMLMASLTVIPIAGAGTVLSFVLLLLAWAWTRGHDSVNLPARVGALELNETWTRRCLHGLAWLHERSQRWLRPRWQVWSHRTTRPLWGAWIVLMAGVIFLPLPFGNVLPSVSLVLLSLGWMARDGVALLLSTAVGAAALAYTVSLGHIALDLVARAGAWLGL